MPSHDSSSSSSQHREERRSSDRHRDDDRDRQRAAESDSSSSRGHKRSREEEEDKRRHCSSKHRYYSDSDSDSSDDDRHKRRHKHRSEKKSRRHRSPSPPPQRRTQSDEEPNEQSSVLSLEEKLRRKLEKKRRHEEAERELAALGYSNESNPFGDSNLTEKFVWKKKQSSSSASSSSSKSAAPAPAAAAAENDDDRAEELRREVLKMRQRRTEREQEKQQWEKEKERIMREKELASMEGWEQKEDAFHLRQMLLRAEIRIREGRARPIDLIANNLRILDENFGKPSDDLLDEFMRMPSNAPQQAASSSSAASASEVAAQAVLTFDLELREPYRIIESINNIEEMENLRDDVREYLDLDRGAGGKNRDFWVASLLLCNHHLAEVRTADAAASSSSSTNIHSSIKQDIAKLFVGKSLDQLEEMQREIEKTLQNPDATTDTGYWDALLRELKVFKARALLRQVHTTVLDKYLAKLKEAKLVVAEAAAAASSAASENEDARMERKQDYIQRIRDALPTQRPRAPEAVADIDTEDNYEPEEGALLGDEQAPLSVQRGDSAAASMNEDDMMRAAQRYSNEDGDLLFNGEVALPSIAASSAQEYAYNDKYRPRKPRFFNKVHIGYDWTRYNSVHYDKDNPPPKIVQGYKFNMFYPDLIDKSKTPTYYIEKDGQSKDTCIIRFHAGPPYEDVAFRIVNREWEYSQRRGFRCVFDKGILQLHFKFKRYRYRR